MTKVVCISNLEGYLPQNLPCGDVLVIAGGIFPYSRHSDVDEQLISHAVFWETILRPWLTLKQNIFDKILLTYGYSDILPYVAYLENSNIKHHKYHAYKNMFNLLKESISTALPYKVHDITDKTFQYKDIKFYGSPWNSEISTGFAFSNNETQLKERWDSIPKDVNVLVTHEAPKYVGSNYFGSESLYNTSQLLPKLKYHVFGHTHYKSRRSINEVTYINCTYT